MLEYESVLCRPEHLAAMGLNIAEVEEFLDALAGAIEPVTMRFLWRPRLRDPGDEMVLETAVNGHADRLITFNVRHLAAAAKEFGIRVLEPGPAWREMRERI